METTSVNGEIYNVEALHHFAEHLPTESVDLKSLQDQVSMDHTYWLDRNGKKLGPFDFLKDWDSAQNTFAWDDHRHAIQTANLDNPLFIMRPTNLVFDGMHRLTKAFLEQRETLPAKFFDTLPDESLVPGQHVTLRPLQKSDITYFSTWWTDKDLLALTSRAPAATGHEIRDYFAQMLQDADAEHFMIDVDDVTIGHISLGQRDGGWYETQIVIGNQDYWSKGYGPAAIKEIMQRAAIKGIEKIYLEVWPDNDRAIRAYEKAGFVKTRAGDLLRMEYKNEPTR